MLGLMIDLLRRFFPTYAILDVNVPVNTDTALITKSPLRIRIPLGANCSSCSDFKILSDPIEMDEWTCGRCVSGMSPDHTPRHYMVHDI